MNFRPLHDRIAIKPHAEEEKTSGGIIIPDTAKEKPMKGKVVAVGSGARDQSGSVVPLEVKVGDTVKSFKATKVSDFKNYQDDIIKGLVAEQKRIIKLQARRTKKI